MAKGCGKHPKYACPRPVKILVIPFSETHIAPNDGGNMDQHDSATDAPTQRILIIAETIARHGPITLAQLTDQLQFSRGAIWRAIDTMRAMGWVRMRLGDNAYEIRSALADLFQHGHQSRPEIDLMAPMIARVIAAGPVHVDIGHFTETGVFRVVETTRKPAPTAPLSLCDDDLAIAAQLALSPQILVGHLRAFMTTARDDERRTITSGEHGRLLASLRDARVIWQDDGSTVAFPLAQYPGFALRAELWRTLKSDISLFFTRMRPILGLAAQPLLPR